MNQKTRRQIGAAGLRIARRLAKAEGGQPPLGDGPEFAARTIHYEIAERTQAITCGGIGAVNQLAEKVGLVKALDTRLPILKRRRPYSETDHILNIVYNTMCGGLVPTQILRSGRQLIYRLLAWRPEFPIFFRLLDAL